MTGSIDDTRDMKHDERRGEVKVMKMEMQKPTHSGSLRTANSLYTIQLYFHFDLIQFSLHFDRRTANLVKIRHLQAEARWKRTKTVAADGEEANDREEMKERQGKNSADSGKKRTRQVKVAGQKMHNRMRNSILKMTQMGSCMVGNRVEEWKNVYNSAFSRSLAALSHSLSLSLFTSSLFHIFLCFQYFSSHFESIHCCGCFCLRLNAIQYCAECERKRGM